MTDYAVGDLQGCYDDFRRLLDQLRFQPGRDRVLLTGDLVNRGPASLACLRFVRELGASAVTVLGNHDLHLLAMAYGGAGAKKDDTLGDILDAPDRDELLDWLARQPLAWRHERDGSLMIHAGLASEWTVEQALTLAAEASAVIAGGERATFFAQMYGDQPDRWDEALAGWDRIRFTVNCLTRLRYVHADGRLALKFKGRPGKQPEGQLPWFAVPGRRSAGTPILFGHWSTLGRVEWPEHGVFGLDSGCLWGGSLTALELGSGRITQLACAAHSAPGD